MRRLFVTAALLPLALASAARAETKITTAVTTPVKTSTAAGGAPDDLTIDSAGSVKPTAAGAAVTLDSNNAVKNAGVVGFNNVSGATGVLALGGHTGSVTNTGAINLLEDYTPADADNDGDPDGPFAQGSARFGVRVTGPAAFTGDIRSNLGASITVEGADSAAISVETQLAGNLVDAGAISVIGDRSVGLSAQQVTGDVRVTGAVVAQGGGASGVVLNGDVGGALLLQNAITATGYRSTERLADSVRAKLDADDLLQGGAAVRVTASVGQGILLDKPPADKDASNPDEDNDGTPDAQESTASVTSFGAAPALDLGSGRATTIGAVGTGENGYGLVIRGAVTGAGVNDGVAATAIRVGQAGGGTTTLVGGINNQGGTISASAFGADVTAQGGAATALLINAGAAVPALKNSGVIQATLAGGSQDARAIVDLSGSLKLVENTGAITAAVTPKAGSTNLGQAIAIDLSANTTGAVVRQSKATETSKPAIVGEVRFGSGDDRLEVLGGAVAGAISFGAGADTLVLDGGASVAGKLTDSDGRLTIDVENGRLALANTGALQVSALTLGPKAVLAVTIDPVANTATRFDVSGAASLASGSSVELSLASLLKGAKSFELIKAASLQAGAVGTSLMGAPFLYQATLRADAAAGSLNVDLRPKTAAELGLNRSGAQAYSAVFAALDKDPAIGGAFLAQKTQGGFRALYDQMLPDHSGGALMSAAAISGAISQAVGQALPHDGYGGSAIWAQEIAFRIDRDREQAAGFTSTGYGLAGGAEMVGEKNALGLAASFVTTEYKDKGAEVGERVVMNFAEAGAYWRLRQGPLQADARAGVGYVWFDGDRRLGGAGLSRSTRGKWNGWLADAHAGASYVLKAGAFYARPEISLDYIRLSEDGYQEAGGGAGFDLKVESRDGDLFTGQALVAFGWEFGEDQSHWAPELKLGWRQKISGAPGVTAARFQGGTAFTLDPETPSSGGGIVRLGLKATGDQMYFALDGGAAIDDRTREYDVRGTIRFRF
ncbi:autotransporter outer membrane beta-barrel domain-containing protein [Phenylobacterium soli]|uniref:Autotransporter domain-containing protein n=1 Tax=Phenylobacterium soli TaxID=2170551 RepID=A0A328AEP8_9CAUL|nr:autotransporter outer membrane beta-barrel domain-containing protein [Phenylobacterium soli]RAK53170.1 autotransporter domain-containing protein [Phenylobacterium soli]